jgi:hypothetical protein
MKFILLGFILLVGLTTIAILTTVDFTVLPSVERSSPSIINTQKPMTSENLSKLGASLRLRLSSPSAENARVNILLRTNGTLTAEQRGQLEALGAEVRTVAGDTVAGDTVAGDIVTASIDLQQIPALSEQAFIRYIELSQSLRPESP